MPKIVHARLDEKSQKIFQRLSRCTGWPDSKIIRRGIRALAEQTLMGPHKHIMGLGIVRSAVSDLASNKKHLKGFGR